MEVQIVDIIMKEEVGGAELRDRDVDSRENFVMKLNLGSKVKGVLERHKEEVLERHEEDF